jgi:TonB-linked SusC/RagA family outer membrane protein
MKKITVLFCLILAAGALFAQNVQVSGVVTDAADGQPLPGVSVVVKGTTATAVTDVNGRYTINVAGDATLVFSFIGMKTQEEAVAGRATINVVLEVTATQLSEVVVTALGITREKKALGYAVQEVRAEALTESGQLNVANALSGKIAGLQITQQGGQVGASQNIVIRGNSSFGNNQPLIVIDGVPVSNDNNTSNVTSATVNLGSGLNDINPNDIESISVLKGGSAALYGMRAGNGVIVITTKSGKSGKGKGVIVSYDGDFTVDQVYGLPPFQNKYGQGYNGSEYDWKLLVQDDGYTGSYADFAREYGYFYVDGSYGVNDGADESWGPRLDIGLNLPQFNSPVVNGVRQATPWVSHPNNIKDFFQLGYSTNHTISLASASDYATTRASISYRSQEGTVPNTNLERYAATLNTTYAVNKYVDFDIAANYIYTTSGNLPGTEYEATNTMQSLLQWVGRQVNMKDLKANYDQQENGEYTHYNWISDFHANPYWTLYKNTTQYKRHRVYGKSSLWFKPTDWLKFEGRLGIDHFNSDQLSVIYWNTDYPDGYFRDYNRHTTEINADFIAYFNKQVGDFNIGAIAGTNYRDYDYAIKGIGGDQLTVPGLYTVTNVAGVPYTEENHELRRSNSVYANASIGWKSQLYVDVSARNDWDSTIEDAFFYPSISGSWVVSESLPFIKQGNYLSFLKLRGGWAQIGSATDPYKSGSYYRSEASGMSGISLFSKPFILPPQGLRPEKVSTWEIGIEAAFVDSRIRLDAAYYNKVTTDQIMEVNTAVSAGYTSMLINAGEISNKGVEIQLSADIFRNTQGFNWTASLNWSKDKSKIVELYTDPNTGEALQAYTIGTSWSVSNLAVPGKSWGTLRGAGYTYNDDGSILVRNGLPVGNAAQDIGDVTPDWLAGFQNEFSYKGWSLGFLLDFRMGGDIYSLSQAFGAYTGIYDFTADGNIRENGVIAGQNVLTDKVFKNADGSVNATPVDAETFFSRYYTIPEMAIVNGSYLKLREAHLTYTFPSAWLAKTKYISGAKISLVGSNLALLWTHKSNLIGLDPESTLRSGNNGVGFEENSYPPSRSIGLKLSLTF